MAGGVPLWRIQRGLDLIDETQMVGRKKEWKAYT